MKHVTSPKRTGRLWAYRASYRMGTGVLPRELSCLGVKATSQVHLAPRLRVSGAVYLLPYTPS